VSEEVHPLRSRLRELYYGHEPVALRCQGVLMVLDLAIVGFFIFAQFIRDPAWFWVVDAFIAVFLVLDMSARLYALGTVRRWLLYPSNWADLVVLSTLVIPAFANLGFLRILRLWVLVHRERFWNVLGGGRWDDTYVEDVTQAIMTLVTFVFIAAGVTQALFLRQHPELNNFVDAIYFVVSSLTTTGYGDITLNTAWGRLFSVGLMVAGISLFLSIAQKTVTTPRKTAKCNECGLDKHDVDAKHCKVCGELLGPRLRGRARGARG
jgi:voltage-gated potassium channel